MAEHVGGDGHRGVLDAADHRSTPPDARGCADPARRLPAARHRRRSRRRHPRQRTGSRRAMLFVRNPTGVSHSPDEYAERDDCLAGVDGPHRRPRRPVPGATAMTDDYLGRARTGCPAGSATRVRLEVADGRFSERRTPRPPRARRRPARTASSCPGFANAHSHAFHRALRGRTHGDGGNFWTWREQMYAVARPARPGHLPRAGPGGLRRDGAGRDHRRRRVPLPPPRRRRPAATPTRTPWARR